MTIQIASVRHEGSNIRQALFIDWDQQGATITRRFHMQGTGFGQTSNVYPSEAEARATLAAWAYLVEREEAELIQLDLQTLRSVFKVTWLGDLRAEGEAAYEAEYLAQGDCPPEHEEDCTRSLEYSPEAQDDLDRY